MRSRGDHDDAPTTSRRGLLAAGGAAGAALLGGCLGGGAESVGGDDTAAGTATADGDSGWRSIELDPVRGGDAFTIGELSTPAVVHSFAVWCPKCERLSTRLAEVAGEYTILGLNTDPNEDADTVREYAEDHGFGWRFAVAPTELTGALVDDFGSAAVNAPSTPVIVVCGDGTATFLSGGDSALPTIEATAGDC